MDNPLEMDIIQATCRIASFPGLLSAFNLIVRNGNSIIIGQQCPTYFHGGRVNIDPPPLMKEGDKISVNFETISEDFWETSVELDGKSYDPDQKLVLTCLSPKIK